MELSKIMVPSEKLSSSESEITAAPQQHALAVSKQVSFRQLEFVSVMESVVVWVDSKKGDFAKSVRNARVMFLLLGSLDFERSCRY